MQDTGLPVEEVTDDLRRALADQGSAVVVAPPGSGKTTVVPLRLMDTVPGKIVVLEPRRLATRAAARRMAALLGEPVGRRIGYVTRHDRATSSATQVEVVTEGILTRRLQSDPDLNGTSLVIFDEVHERNLQTDLGLALTLDVRGQLRPDLQVMAMSATVDAGPIARLLGGAAVITASGRPHEVDVRWDPPPPRSRHLEQHVAAVVNRALAETEGDVLVFLPGMAEIRRVSDRLTGVLADVRILHGSLSTEEQDLALASSEAPFRKVVLATDIAESSLTVEGVSVVVDSGMARAPRFDKRTGMTRLQTVPISRASADQRAGRAGRLGPGVAYRLWSKMEHAARRPHIDPEIGQVDLAGLALELFAWGVSEPSKLRWLDPPPKAAWSEAVELLEALGAIEDGHLTASGHQMAALPLHPRLARMVTDAGADQPLAVWLATVIDERDPMRGPPDDVPVDAALRVRLLTDRTFRHPAAAVGALHRLRDVASDLARRVRLDDLTEVDLERTGAVLALAFPDRLALRRGSPGRFQLRTGTTAFMSAADPLATEEFVVAADLDGRRKDARIRLAGAIAREEVAERFARQVDKSRVLTWEGDRLVDRTQRRLGGMVLDITDRRPEPGEATVAALMDGIRSRGVDSLPWTRAATDLRQRVAHLHARVGEEWPDWSDDGLMATLDEWLAPYLVAATGWDDVEGIDLISILRDRLGHHRVRELDRAAPTHLTLPSGRRVRLDYTRDNPTVSVRVQEVFGVEETPTVGDQPVTMVLLSPAGRPIQITSDLAGFWKGSWQEVRKEMAGRYPKHSWPEHP
jgi:ATP-dependent helicase HrpB